MRFQESETLELKRNYSESIRKEIVAFANSSGGVIYIGVDDTGETVGVESPDKLIQRIGNAVRDAVRPDVTMFLRYDTIEVGGKRVVRVAVSRGTARPYYLAEKGLTPGGVYVRQGTSAAPASETAIRQFIKETDGDSYEAMRSLDQDLTFTYAEEQFKRKGLDLAEPQLKTLGLMMSDGLYTNLGLLLSDQCPHLIRAATFAGGDQEVFQDRREFSGSLLKQLNEAYAYLELRNERSASFEGLYRTDHSAYPESALREALLNAIVHRDYGISASTLISVYSNRIEMVSAGGLMPGFSLNDVLTGFSICRNPKLANIFYRLDLVEAYGTGLRKIQSAYPALTAEQLMHVTDHVFKVILPRGGQTLPTPETRRIMLDPRKVIFEYIRDHGSITRAIAEEETGFSTSYINRLLRMMVGEGELEVVGGGRGTHYILPRTAQTH